MSTVTTEYRQMTPRAVWMTARARNAMHRPIFIGAVSVGTFVTALVALVVMPQQAQRAARAIAPRPGERPDTIPVSASAAASQQRYAAAESALMVVRVRGALAAQAAVDTLSPAVLAKRDALVRNLGELGKALTRAENAPLPASYRALAELPELSTNPRVRSLLDSLSEIEKERDGFGAVGGVDPVFVALTTRATEIGRSIASVGEAQRDTLKSEIAAIAPVNPRPALANLATADTMPLIAERGSARDQLEASMAELVRDRQKLAEVDARLQRAHDIATVNAPPLALLSAALVFGVVLGFGSALVDELRHPRIANAHEAERVGGARVLAVIEPRPPTPERNRRMSDRIAPRYLDPKADGYQLVYLHIAASAPKLLMLTVTGEEGPIAAVVAANLAAIAADEAKNTLLVDADLATGAVAPVLRIAAEPGVVDILAGRVGWPEATIQTTIGRDRHIDVVPSGSAPTLSGVTDVSSLLRQDGARLSRHYDAVFVVASAEQSAGGLPSVLPVPDVIYCARVGKTRLGALKKAIESLSLAGGRPIGVVLWHSDPPVLQAPTDPPQSPQLRSPRPEQEAVAAERRAAEAPPEPLPR